MWDLHLQPDDQVNHCGCVGTGTPFVEHLAIAVRGKHHELINMPLLDNAKARKLHGVVDSCNQVRGEMAVLNQR